MAVSDNLFWPSLLGIFRSIIKNVQRDYKYMKVPLHHIYP